MFTYTLQASFLILSLCTTYALAQGANHANVHRGWHLGQGPYFCGSDADGDGPELLAAVLGPKCGATIWVKNTGTFGTSVNNGIGKCIQAKLVDQEGGGAVDLNPAAWSALTNSPDGQVAVEWGYGSCPSGGESSTSTPDNSRTSSSSDQRAQSSSDQGSQSSSDQKSQSSSDQQAQSSSGEACSVQANKQCGGQDFTGCTTCADGMQCTFFNDWWSDCKPGGVISRVRRGLTGVRNL